MENQEIKIQDIPEAKVFLKNDKVYIDEKVYYIIENYKDGLNIDALQDRYTTVLQKYDYIVGDWGHEQLRLKGFYKESNKKVDSVYHITALQDYLREYCAFGCAYFVIQLDGIPTPAKEIEPIPLNDKKTRKKRAAIFSSSTKKEKQTPSKNKNAFKKELTTQKPKKKTSKHTFTIRKSGDRA